MADQEGLYKKLMWVIGSAVAAVAMVFGLFNSVLSDLVPPIEDSQKTLGFASLGTVIVLLVLTLVIRKTLTQYQTRTVALSCVVLFVLTLVVYFEFRDYSRTYVYRFPPMSVASDQQVAHIRGPLHEMGLKRVAGKTVAQTVFELGGPDQVNAMGTLWTEDARLTVVNRLERFYVGFILLMTTALFSAGIAVWRQRETRAPAETPGSH